MVLERDCYYRNSKEDEIKKILISIINLFGENGLPLAEVDSEFRRHCGFSIPYKNFGAESLRSWILTLPDIYLLDDILYQQSLKSVHVKDLILKQKQCYKSTAFKRKWDGNNYNGQFVKSPKRQKKFEPQGSHPFLEGCFLHTSINDCAINNLNRFTSFKQLECMLPLFYNHQALGDDFFLDIADTKLGYYVPENGPKECGLCAAGQYIKDLTEKVKSAELLAPRVVVMIGFQDLLHGKNVNNMIYDLRQLIIELKKKNTRVTLITLIPTPKLPNCEKLQYRMQLFNRSILEYACDDELGCNVIDMNTIFLREAETFRRDYDRFTRVAKKDSYKVFSDYGRKVFLSALKSCLREQIEVGH